MSTFSLKLVSLILMTIDHIGQFIPNCPIWFRWVGRLSAPIFLFCAIEAFIHTSNKVKYVQKLYMASVIMSAIQLSLNISNNFFRVIFSTIVIVYILHLSQIKDVRFKKSLLLYSGWQITSIILAIFMFSVGIDENFVAYMLPAITGSIFNLEGGMIFVVLGVLMFVARKSPKNMILSYLIFCTTYFILSSTSIINIILGKLYIWGFGWLKEIVYYILDNIIGLRPMLLGGNIFTQNFQWMMVFSLPLLMMYNHKKGYYIKWLFYIYYPLHIIFLFLIGNYCFN